MKYENEIETAGWKPAGRPRRSGDRRASEMTTEEKADTRRFHVGEVYIATPALEGLPRKLGVVIGKEGASLQVAFVDELVAARAQVLDGRDFATLETRTGRYNISARVKAEAKDAAIVNDILREREKAEGTSAIKTDD